LYCDFVSAAASQQTIAAYCFALEKEIRAMGEKYAGVRVSTVFLGGGTPSIVPAPLMKSVLGTLRESFSLREDAEFTTEANPGTLTEAWLETVMEAGVNRLSLGVQATQDALLNRIGRIHTFGRDNKLPTSRNRIIASILKRISQFHKTWYNYIVVTGL
jgi:oxygen-independent coproporphyrinogen-3 oxidase